MPPKKNLFTITREEAAATLGVSTRTLDRYLKNNKLRSKLINRSVSVHSEDLAKLAKEFAQKQKRSRKSASPRAGGKAAAEPVGAMERGEEKVFRALYHEATVDLKAKQEKLEAASFRVGQLEAQLKNSVPLLEHKQKAEELGVENARLQEKLVATILKSWIFLGGMILTAFVAATLGMLLYF